MLSDRLQEEPKRIIIEWTATAQANGYFFKIAITALLFYHPVHLFRKSFPKQELTSGIKVG